MSKRIVVALGGNAIKQANEKGSYEEQMKNVDITAKQLIKLLKEGHQLVITHGNGPQAGALLLQNENSTQEVPAQPLDAINAMTQGQVGYMLLQTLTNLAIKEGITLPVVAINNQVLVSQDDPDYQDPSKPVGSFYTESEAKELQASRPDWIIKEVKPNSVERRFRRVVPSPDPIENIEAAAIKQLVENGMVVIASGGGGIPVVKNEDGTLKGVAAVIDKDLAGERLAEVVGADIFLILTDVSNACIHYATPQERKLERVTYQQMEQYVAEGHFAAGSMGPKVKAAMRFVAHGGCSIITSLDQAFSALSGEAGTQIIQ